MRRARKTPASTANIEGSLVLIDTDTNVAEGAHLHGDLVVIGGQFNAPADFAADGSHVVIDNHTLGGRLEGLFTWITRGLLWGRPIVPQLKWVWAAVIVFFGYQVAPWISVFSRHSCDHTSRGRRFGSSPDATPDRVGPPRSPGHVWSSPVRCRAASSRRARMSRARLRTSALASEMRVRNTPNRNVIAPVLFRPPPMISYFFMLCRSQP
jgi:hypothetical protein